MFTLTFDWQLVHKTSAWNIHVSRCRHTLWLAACTQLVCLKQFCTFDWQLVHNIDNLYTWTPRCLQLCTHFDWRLVHSMSSCNIPCTHFNWHPDESLYIHAMYTLWLTDCLHINIPITFCGGPQHFELVQNNKQVAKYCMISCVSSLTNLSHDTTESVLCFSVGRKRRMNERRLKEEENSCPM